jgi:hypothetical protein
VPGQPYPGTGPPKKGRGGKIALIIGLVVLLLLCGCVGAGWWLVREANDEIQDQVDALPTGVPSAPATPDEPGGVGDEDFNKGDCVVNEGTDAAPELKKVACGPNTFEVIAVIPFSTDKDRCDNDILGAGKGNWDSSYTFDESPGSLGDFVLCLKARK